MASLITLMTSFEKDLKDCATSATVYDIDLYLDGLVPKVKNENEKEIERVTVQRIDGEHAIDIAIKSIRGFSLLQEQHPGSVARSPGVLFLNRDLSEKVSDINELKNKLKQFMVDNFKTERDRGLFYKANFQGRVMKQVYRNIYVNEAPVERILFTWMPTAQTTNKLTSKETLKRLNKYASARYTLSNSDIVESLDEAIRTVRNSEPDTYFAYKKRLAPCPLARVYYSSGKEAETKTITASTPLLIGPSSSRESVELGQLGDYVEDDRKKRKTRSDKKVLRSLFSPLNLYCYVN